MKRLALSEQQLLKYFYTHPENIKEEYDYFLSEVGATIFNALVDIREKGMVPNKTDLLKHCLDYSSVVKEETLDFLDSIEISKENFAEYLSDLKGIFVRNNIEENELKDVIIEIAKKKPNYEQLESKLNNILLRLRDIYHSSEDDEEFILTEMDEVERYMEILELRKNGHTYSSGDMHFDKLLYNRSLMPGEISIVFGPSGSGKTSFVLGLGERRRIKNLPTLQINIEMSLESSLDAKMSSRLKIDRTDLTLNYDLTEEEEALIDKKGILQQHIDKVETQKRRAKRSTNYRHINCYSLNFAKLENYVVDAKRAMGLSNSDYLFVSIDLLTQMDEFDKHKKGQTKADSYEHGMNNLSRLAKKHNIHIMGVVQPKRPADKVSIKTPDDVEKLRVNTEDLKNSGAIEERARLVVSVFRKMHFVKKYIPEDPYVKYEDDLLEISTLKQNNYKIGDRIYYLFNPEQSSYHKVDWIPDTLEDSDNDDEDE